MGNNSSMISVTFDRTQPTIYYTGETISGHVQFTVPERASNIEDVYLTITGNVGYTTMRMTRMQNGQTDRITDRHDIRIFAEKVVFGQAMLSPQEKASRGIDETTMIEAGQYTYPFAIRLPDILPPTIHPNDYPYVRYELQLIVEKKWYCANTRHRYPLRIYPRVNLLHVNNSRCAVKFDTKRNDMAVKGIIQRSGLVPGEQTTLTLEIENPNHLAIRRLDVCLIQRYDIEQCRRRLEVLRISVPQFLNTSDEHIETSCPIIIPMGLAPSFNFKSKGGRSSVYVTTHYDIKLEVKAKGLFSDFELQVPFIIGTDTGEQLNGVDMTIASATATDLNAIDLLESQVDNDERISPTS